MRAITPEVGKIWLGSRFGTTGGTPSSRHRCSFLDKKVINFGRIVGEGVCQRFISNLRTKFASNVAIVAQQGDEMAVGTRPGALH
jgi:hypothetical protein